MTTTDAPSKYRYEGNGVTDTFSFDGRIFNEEDIAVDIILRADDSLVDTLTLATDYTVTINGPSSASVVVTAPNIPSAAQDILLRRALVKTQDLRLPTGTVFPASSVETALDKNTALIQDLQDVLDRSLTYPANISGITDLSLPSPVDGAALIFDGTTGRLAASIPYISDAVTQAVADATEGVTGTSLITATSTTSLTVTGTGSKVWTIASGRGFAIGQRLRAVSDDGTKINEGVVVSYIGTALTINVDYVSGSGTHADWNISVAGDRGAAGAGTGDMLASNNLSDVADAATSFNTIKQSATTTNSGVVELATDAETITGTDTGRAVTPAGLSAAAFVKLQSTVSVSSGTNVDISTAIPAGVRRVTVLLSGISNSGTGVIGFQLGDSGGYETTGYAGAVTNQTTGVVTDVLSTSFALNVSAGHTAAAVYNGKAVFENIGGNEWQCTMHLSRTDAGATIYCVGNKTLSATLTSIRLNTSNAFDTTGAAIASISWEF